MAFHVACPITCRRICDCELGFPAGRRGGGGGREGFAREISRLEEFLKDPWCLRGGGGDGDDSEATVQVEVPHVVPLPDPVAADDGHETAVAQVKRAAMQQQAVAASMAAEDYVRRLEAGDALETQGEAAGEDQASSTIQIMCRICFSGEREGSERALKMLSCKMCNKKYHRSCLKSWAENRDLFHWSSWACPSCRICEVCRRAGDPTKLMYCKRCDAAYHCYCQQPPHKNVSHGPYLCPKHTRCHSCGSTVPGSGLSTRWFLGYTCCDACGRLFTKGNYCPVCLKVYRDSEVTPMVCCDVCQRWVHCLCDGISDEKYQQFQADQNLYYKCAACRGGCYQIKDIDDAVQELWKRRDEADHDLIASLREAAGLPSQEEIFSLSPYSDDEQNCPVLKNDLGRSLKFSFKGLSDKSAKDSKERKLSMSNKKNAKKKGYQIKFVHKSEEAHQNFERQHGARSLGSSFGNQNIGGFESCKANVPELFSSSMIRSPCNDDLKTSVNQLGDKNHNFVKEITANNVDRVSKVYSKVNKVQGVHIKESAGENESKIDTVKGTKLVIHLGTKNRTMSSSPRSETSSCHKEQDITTSFGAENTYQPKTEHKDNCLLEDHGVSRFGDGKGARLDDAKQSSSLKHGNREKNILKLGKVSEIHKKGNGNVAEENEFRMTRGSPLITRKRSADVDLVAGTAAEAILRNDEFVQKEQFLGTPGNLQSDSHETLLSKYNPSSGDLKPLLKLKFKNPYFEQRSSWAPRGEEENAVKGQRSKRKRPADQVGLHKNDSYVHLNQECPIDEAMDAKILQKLGKDAVGKRVEVHQLPDNSWHQGVVSGTIEGTSSLTIRLDDGRTTTLELGKQGVRFVAKKRKRTSS